MLFVIKIIKGKKTVDNILARSFLQINLSLLYV